MPIRSPRLGRERFERRRLHTLESPAHSSFRTIREIQHRRRAILDDEKQPAIVQRGALEHDDVAGLEGVKADLQEIVERSKAAPDSPDARLLLGKVYLELGNGPAAEKELRAARQEWAAAEGREPDSAGQPTYDEAEMQDRQDRILSDLDYLRGQDEVSQAELDLLMAEIARLDPERRSEMFKELNRAMNRGEIRGNL